MISILINSSLIVALAFLMQRKLLEGNSKLLFWGAYLFKLVAGIILGVIYYRHYGAGDTIQLFNEAKNLGASFFTDPLNYLESLISSDTLASKYATNPRSLVFIKLLSPITILSGGNYWITSIYLSTMSFAACWRLFLTLIKNYPSLKHGAAFGLLFMPSFVFWSSGVLKESVSVTILCYLSTQFIRWHSDVNQIKPVKLVISSGLLVMLFFLKYYYAAIFIIAVTPTVMLISISQKTPIKYPFFSWMVLFGLITFTVSSLHPNLAFQHFMDVLVSNYDMYSTKQIAFSYLENSFQGIIISAPKAIFSGWFRPFVWEANNVLQLLAGLENSLLLLYFVGFLIKKPIFNKHQLPFIFTWAFYLLSLSVILTIATPNFGSLSRYRISFLPVLVILLSHRNYFVARIDAGISNLLTRNSK